MSQDEVVDSLHVYVPALGKMTSRGYGVALAHPLDRKGVICWYRNRQAYIAATQDADERRRAGMDASEFHFADDYETFPDGDAATRALLRYNHPVPTS